MQLKVFKVTNPGQMLSDFLGAIGEWFDNTGRSPFYMSDGETYLIIVNEIWEKAPLNFRGLETLFAGSITSTIVELDDLFNIQ